MIPVPKRGLQLESKGPVPADDSAWEIPGSYQEFSSFTGTDFTFSAKDSLDSLEKAMPTLPELSAEELQFRVSSGTLLAVDLPKECRTLPDSQESEEAALVNPSLDLLDAVHGAYKAVCKELEGENTPPTPTLEWVVNKEHWTIIPNPD